MSSTSDSPQYSGIMALEFFASKLGKAQSVKLCGRDVFSQNVGVDHANSDKRHGLRNS